MSKDEYLVSETLGLGEFKSDDVPSPRKCRNFKGSRRLVWHAAGNLFSHLGFALLQEYLLTVGEMYIVLSSFMFY